MRKNPPAKFLAAAMLFLLGLNGCAGRTGNSANGNSNANTTKAETTTAAQATPKPAGPTFTSAYTDMKNDCKTLEEPPGAEEGGDPAGECKGYGGYRIFISHSAWAANYSVQNIKNPDESIELGPESSNYGAKGEKIEWRMVDGKPFAVIMRLGKYKDSNDGENPFTDKNRTGSTLIIKGLRGWEHIDFTVDGATPTANEKAREMADQNYVKNKG